MKDVKKKVEVMYSRYGWEVTDSTPEQRRIESLMDEDRAAAKALMLVYATDTEHGYYALTEAEFAGVGATLKKMVEDRAAARKGKKAIPLHVDRCMASASDGDF